MEKSNELDFIVSFCKDVDLGYDSSREQLRCLWTAYALHHDLECDTEPYDRDLLYLWSELEKNTSCPCVDDEADSGYELFARYMCEKIV